MAIEQISKIKSHRIFRGFVWSVFFIHHYKMGTLSENQPLFSG